MLYVLALAAENSRAVYGLIITDAPFSAWCHATHGAEPSDDSAERTRQLQDYVCIHDLTRKQVTHWHTESEELRSHAVSCPQRMGQECTCGAFEHNERIYGIEEERETREA